jgi:hypothetical protein
VTLPPFSDGWKLEFGRFRAAYLTLFGVLTRRQVTECAVRTKVIVVAAPRFDQALRVRDRFEAVHVETCIAEATVEAFDKRVFYGLAGPDEVEGDAPSLGPLVERLRGEFGAVIDRNRLRQRAAYGDGFQGLDDALPSQRHIGLQ